MKMAKVFKVTIDTGGDVGRDVMINDAKVGENGDVMFKIAPEMVELFTGRKENSML